MSGTTSPCQVDFFFRFPAVVTSPDLHGISQCQMCFFHCQFFLSVCSVDGPAAVAPASGGASRSSSASRTAVEPVCDRRGHVRCRHRQHSRRGGVPTQVSTPASTGDIIRHF